MVPSDVGEINNQNELLLVTDWHFGTERQIGREMGQQSETELIYDYLFCFVFQSSSDLQNDHVTWEKGLLGFKPAELEFVCVYM